MSTNDTLAVSRAETLVENLAAVGCKAPAELTKALDLVQAIRRHSTEVPAIEAALEGATAANVAKRLGEVIDARSRMTEARAVRAEALEIATRQVRLARNNNTDTMLAGCAEGFRSTAEEFTKLHAELPNTWRDPAAMLEDQDGIDTFRKAKALVPVLDMYRSIAYSLIPVRRESAVHEVTRTIDLEHWGIATTADRVTPAGTLGRWGDLLDVAGVKGFIWHESARAHADYAKSLPAPPKQKMRNLYAS